MNSRRSLQQLKKTGSNTSRVSNVKGQNEINPLTTTFVIGYQNWLEFYHKDIDYLVEFLPQGFYDSESASIGVLLSDFIYFRRHWFYVYNHEILHHVLRTIEGEEASKGLDSICQYMLINNKLNPFEIILRARK